MIYCVNFSQRTNTQQQTNDTHYKSSDFPHLICSKVLLVSVVVACSYLPAVLNKWSEMLYIGFVVCFSGFLHYFTCALDIQLNEENCGLSWSDRIVGGENAKLGQYPWLARLGYNSKIEKICVGCINMRIHFSESDGIKFECGGALISKLHVLTATHCIRDIEPYMV